MKRADPAWLLIDTAAPRGVVGVARGGAAHGGRVIAERFLVETRRHAEELPFAIDAVLEIAGVSRRDLAGIAVGRGPGSFVGVRVGMATAKGLALGLGVALRGVSTLLALARSVELPAGDGLVALDARRGELYAARVASSGERTLESEIRAVALAGLPALLPSPAFVVGWLGPDREKAVAAFSDPPPVRELEGPTALGLVRALPGGPDDVTDEGAALVPDYCRAPDAKLPSS